MPFANTHRFKVVIVSLPKALFPEEAKRIWERRTKALKTIVWVRISGDGKRGVG